MQSRITIIAFKNEWQAQWLANSRDLQKPRRRVNIMDINTSAKPSAPDYQINSGQREKTLKFYFQTNILYYC